MDNSDWLEIVEWIDHRFARGWTPDQAVAFFDDLKQFNAEDVWDAVYRLYDRGLEFPPNGSILRKETTEVVRARMERARQERAGLTAGSNEGLGWHAWHDKLGLPESFGEAVELAHRKIYPKGCPFLGCSPCGNHAVA